MQELSRRRFIGSCAAIAGAGVGVGCREPRRGNSGAGPLRYEPKGTAAVQPDFEPGYLALHRTGELRERGEDLWKWMKPCKLCPRTCGIDRLAGNLGFCDAPPHLVIASHHPHFGEERPLVGRGGSGTIFFAHCSLRCVFCINYDVSHEGRGAPREIDDLARMMLRLQERGCHNINVVTPSHYSAHIVLALDRAAGAGLRLPLVYNTCGWENLEVLRKLDGIVDIYLADMKYGSGEMALRYSSLAPPDLATLRPDVAETHSTTETYPELTQMAVREMHRQVGVARPGADGLIYRGLMIRHLVMPNRTSGTQEVMQWIARNLPQDTYVNLMAQYTPVYQATDFPEIARRINRAEYREAVAAAREAGLTNLDVQGAAWL